MSEESHKSIPTMVTQGTCSHLAGVQALLESFYKHHPNGRMFVLLVDQVAGFEPVFDLPVTVIHADELDLPGGRRFLFKYSPFELCCALKPFAMQYILDQYKVESLVYLDSDIIVTNFFWDMVVEEWKAHDVLLTPHLLEPFDCDNPVNQINFLRHGIINGGFIAVQLSGQSFNFLRWWKNAVEQSCLDDSTSGVYVDQKWLDLATSHSCAGVIRDPGFNLGYWNFEERDISKGEDGKWFAQGKPVRFFHFSGFDEQRFSHKKPILTDDALELAGVYAKELKRHDHAKLSKLPYGWGHYTNGQPITMNERNIILSDHPAFRHVANPFALPEHPQDWKAFQEMAKKPVPVRMSERMEHMQAALDKVQCEIKSLQPLASLAKKNRLAGLLWKLYRKLMSKPDKKEVSGDE